MHRKEKKMSTEGIIVLAVGYLLVSFIIGIEDLIQLKHQEDYFDNIPIGDLEFHRPKKILGLHNWIFFPSWLVIGGWILIVGIINAIID